MAQQIKFPVIKPVEISWDTWAKGLNTLLAASKIRDDELSIATNILLVDAGSPQKRWGTANYGNTSGNTGTYGLFPYYKSDGTNKLTKIEGGIFKSYNPTTANWDVVSGASFSSGIYTTGMLAFDYLYLCNGVDALTRYDGASLTRFTALTVPVSLNSSIGISLLSGKYAYSYKVTAVSLTGETAASSAVAVYSQLERDTWNPDVTNLRPSTSATINWNAVPNALGYNIYGIVAGNEHYLDHVDGPTATSWVDYGITHPSPVFAAPTGDTTVGPKGKYITEFKGSLIIAGDVLQPSRVYYSAGLDKIDSFSVSDGGGYVDVSKNSNDGVVKGLANYQNSVIVLKERSAWQFNFTEGEIPSLVNLNKGIGCVAGMTVLNVENDLFFLGRKTGGGPAIYVLGNEPNYLNILRTNEVSARVRPELAALGAANYDKANAVYFDGKYMLFYTDGSAGHNNAGLVYDRERLGFTKWTGISPDCAIVYYDTNKLEYLLYADSGDGRISQISSSFSDDKGVAIPWDFKTKETDLGDPFLYKKFKWVRFKLRNVLGSITVKLWTDSTITAYSQTISVSGLRTSFRAEKFRIGRFRKTVDGNNVSPTVTLIRRIPISRKGTSAIAKSLAFEVIGTGMSSKATLLNLNIQARPKSKNYFPRSEVIS